MRRLLFKAWLARYDAAALRPPLPDDGLSPHLPGAAEAVALGRLTQWCFEGAGDGRSPLLKPWVLPQVDRRFAAMGLPAARGTSALVAALARRLDGTHRLQAAGGRWAGRWLRLRVKLNDACWWRKRRVDDPWDSGYAGGDLAALRRFTPRRATLVIVQGETPAVVRAALAALAPRAAAFRHPVRLLVVGTGLE
jgi:hypothetical protein